MAAAEPIAPEFIDRLASGLRLDAARLKKDMQSDETRQALLRNQQLANAIGLKSHPIVCDRLGTGGRNWNVSIIRSERVPDYDVEILVLAERRTFERASFTNSGCTPLLVPTLDDGPGLPHKVRQFSFRQLLTYLCHQAGP